MYCHFGYEVFGRNTLYVKYLNLYHTLYFWIKKIYPYRAESRHSIVYTHGTKAHACERWFFKKCFALVTTINKHVCFKTEQNNIQQKSYALSLFSEQLCFYWYRIGGDTHLNICIQAEIMHKPPSFNNQEQNIGF